MSSGTRTPDRRSFLAAVAAAAASGVPAVAARAESRVVRLILPNATGSGVDALARAAQPALAKALGASVVVENQPGAGGIVGLQTLARAAADGNALSIVSSNVAIFPSVLKSIPFQMPGDFTPIAMIGATPIVLVANPARVAADNFKDFVALLKGRPGQLNFGSGGNGTILHLSTEMFLDAAGVTAAHVPYTGVGPMVTDLIGGQIDFASAALSSVIAHIRKGSLRAIGMLSAQRVAAARDIPTMAEQGLANFAVDAWFAVLGPRGMSAESVARTHAALVATFDDPAVREAMDRQGNSIKVGSTEDAQRTFRSEIARYAEIVRRIQLQPQ